MTNDDMTNLGRLIAMLPPVPPGLVEAAQQLPKVRRELDDLLRLAEVDAEFRAKLVADLESTLTEAGIEPTRRLVEEVRTRMRSF